MSLLLSASKIRSRVKPFLNAIASTSAGYSTSRARSFSLQQRMRPRNQSMRMSPLAATSVHIFEQQCIVLRRFSSQSDSESDVENDAQSSGDEGPSPAQPSSAIVPQASMTPKIPEVVVIPVMNRPLYPGMYYPVTLDETLARALTSLTRKHSPYVGVFMRRPQDDDAPSDPAFKTYDVSGEMSKPAAAGAGAGAGAAKDETIEGESEEAGAAQTAATAGGSAAGAGAGAKKGKAGNAVIPVKDLSEIYSVGTFAIIDKITKIGSESKATLLGVRRIQITEGLSDSPVMMVRVKHFEEPSLRKAAPEDQNIIKAYVTEMMNTIRDVLRLSPLFKEQLQFFLRTADLSNPSFMADVAATITSASPSELQEVLAATEVKSRLDLVARLLKKELEINRIAHDINKKVEESLNATHRKNLLMQQYKMIRKQLGMEKDDKEPLIEKFRKRLENKVVPKDVLKVIDEEIDKLNMLEPASMEFNVTRNYLDWLTIIPWGIYSTENFDVANAERVLNEDHFGLEDIKERILEFIAVGKLKGAAPQGKILCLIGPPGVGKTSFGKSIARALNREFFRFSVGGMHDVAEIKGHRRTYVGAMPGKLVQCLKKTQHANPVVLIDEIDKLGRGYQGDPASALLEVLDPEQNGSFMDHFMDVPIDLSKVLFICTANVKDTIPGPLADRMDFVRISGYVAQEKVHITRQYLEPAMREKTGLTPEQVVIRDDAVKHLIRWYCREAGVRNLQKHVDRIYRKAALKLVKDSAVQKLEVTADNLTDYVGKAIFSSDRLYEHTPPGVVMGMAWNSMGGATLYIESAVADFPRDESASAAAAGKKKGKKPAAATEIEEEEGEVEGEEIVEANKQSGSGGLFCTGQMGDVMKESTLIAYTVAKSFLHTLDAENDFFRTKRIHLHVPEGATPKDGPSAGITMITSLLSLATNKPTRNIAMTGEVTLTGKVLPIGGVKEKTIAARRSRVFELIFPAQNKKDFDELPDYIKKGLRVHYVEHYSQVHKVAFGDEPSLTGPLEGDVDMD